MGGLSGLASLGYFAGGATKGWEAAAEEKRKQDEADYLKEERARDTTLRDEIAKANNSGQDTLNITTGGLNSENPEAPEVTTTRYRLGDQQQDAPFTPAQREEHVAGLQTRALQNRGTLQSIAAAEQLKTGIQTRQLHELQIKGAKRTEAEAENAAQARSIARRVAAGEPPIEIFKDAAKLNGIVPNGWHLGEAEQGPDGKWYATLTNEATNAKEVKEINAQNLTLMAKHLHQFSSDAAWEKALARDQEDKKIGLEERKVKTAEDKQKTDEKLGAAHVTYYTKAGEALERNSKRGPVGHAASWALVGTDSDGVGVQHDRTSGTFKRIDGGKIQDVNFFKKITGANALSAPDPVEAALIKSVERDPATNMPLLEKYRANKAMNTRRAGYNPEDQGPPAPAPAPASAAPGTGHPVRPQRPPGMSQAEWQRQEVMRIQNEREAARLQDLEGAPEGIDDPMFSRGSPLYR